MRNYLVLMQFARIRKELQNIGGNEKFAKAIVSFPGR
jgi:hypothetical protein